MYDDQYSGQGGSYIVDPKTGKRKRVEAPTTPPDETAALIDNATPAAPISPAGSADPTITGA